ncbi:uncharacterized protein [Cebidichthys violaceus]|uniref:uncharacterized protein n=1 Tax=Cebidichthys violaceus TaxID=271503 RepID=UPI0035CB3F69
MIRALPPQSKARWPQMLQMLTFCYNCTEHETTGAVVDHHDFVSRLKHDLSEAVRIARLNSLTEQARQAKNYNRKAKGSPLTVGDRVLLANRGSVVVIVVVVLTGVLYKLCRGEVTRGKIVNAHWRKRAPFSGLRRAPFAGDCSATDPNQDFKGLSGWSLRWERHRGPPSGRAVVREEVHEHTSRAAQQSERATELEGLLDGVRTRVQDLEDRYLGEAAQQHGHAQQLQREQQEARKQCELLEQKLSQ